ncbi:tubulin polyglutamylase TTLL5 isoform X2 [Lutzomyia longipalpis]|nr:tubulin polyglutamylase TTLL5 isoform X2 [Lutzomyia longipalpis]XP_055678294.1 tubulin polyglutamylase TTLL5 isoform X2 [Lutzomyia longipalpis]
MPTSDKVVRLPDPTVRTYRTSDERPPVYSRKLYKDFLPKSLITQNQKTRVQLKTIKNNYIGGKEVEKKEADNPWVTGGALGTKDAVLVFRTCVLSQHNASSSEPDLVDNGSPSTSSECVAGESLPMLEPSKGEKKSLGKLVVNKLRVQLVSSISEPSIARRNGSDSAGSDQEKEMEFKSISDSETHANEDTRSDSKTPRKDKSEVVVPKDKSEMPGAVLNVRYRFMNTETRLLRKILGGHGLKEAEEDETFNLLWTGIHLKPDILRNLLPYQRVNHFPRSSELTRKDRLYKNIEKMQHLRGGSKNFDIVPESYLLPTEYRDLVSAHNKYRGPWIVKPAASSRGRGIYIVNTLDKIPSDEQLVVAKYISDPLCIDGHKCDVRLYVAVTSFDPLLIYVYEEGLVRLATVKYNRSSEFLWNSCMHLCNYSINKYHSDYIKSRDAGDEDVGHKWTLSALLRHLKSQGCDTEQLMLNIEDVIIKAIFSCAQSIVAACRMFVPNNNNCFELYGFDILIDDTLKPWLLEVNLSPSLGIDTPLDAKVKASLLTDLLNMVGIPAISPLLKAAYDSKYVRHRSLNGRRANSADFIQGSHTLPKKHQHHTLTSLTTEELRIVRSAKAQYARRSGFIRIFPTEDSLAKYGMYMDPITGIPTSTTAPSGTSVCAMIIPHNFNVMLHGQLYPPNNTEMESSISDRMQQYERALETSQPLNLGNKMYQPKSTDEARRLRKQIRKLIENGSEMSQLQARKAFQMYLEYILRRLSTESKQCHEKLILKFIQRSGVNFKTPFFIRNPFSHKILSKDRSALVAKQLGDYMEVYNKETEALSDSFDPYGSIPNRLFNDFLCQAQESDLEAILTIHTNATQQMPFLYNRCAPGAPAAPPIPVGAHGFLKALPNMAPIGVSKESLKIDLYYKSIEARSPEKEIQNGKRLPEKTFSFNTMKRKQHTTTK